MSLLRAQRTPMAVGAAMILLLTAMVSQAAGQAGSAVSSLSATSLTFAATPVDTASAPEVLTLTNTGNAALNVVSIALSGTDFLDFSETNSCGNSVAAGAKCAINVTFDPQSFGTRTATLIITSSASNSPQTVSLTGMGMGPAVSLSSPALSFSSQLVTTSGQQTLRLISSGDQALAISSIAVTGAFSENNTCLSSVLSPGRTCSINVFFTPVDGGPTTGQLTIFDNAVPAQQTVPLSGIGSDFSLSLDPTTNSATAGQSATYTVSVAPVGGFAGSVTLGCGALPPGAACAFAPATVAVTGSSSASSTVTVSTTAASRITPDVRSRPSPPRAIRLLWACVFLLGLSAVTVSRGRRRLALGCTAATALLFAALGMPACGGGSNSVSTVIATPPDGYRLVVTGTAPAGSGSVQSTVILTIVVK